MGAVVIVCGACGTRVSEPLAHLVEMPEAGQRSDGIGYEATIPLGHLSR